jgi:hypothetical protein
MGRRRYLPELWSGRLGRLPADEIRRGGHHILGHHLGPCRLVFLLRLF